MTFVLSCLQFGYTPLLMAAWYGHMELMQWLVEDMGADCHAERNKVSVSKSYLIGMARN